MQLTNFLRVSALVVLTGLGAPALAEEQPTLVVTATRIAEPAASLPQSETLIDGQSLRDRGVFDLRGALATTGGTEVLPGGDTGPAGATLALHGLVEMDAYLLVVDGVPYGGAFNPAIASLDPIDIDRIELLRGAAPVTFGATSFVGVVHLIHANAGEQVTRGWLEAGSSGSARMAFATSLSSSKSLVGQSILGSAETRDDAQNRAGFHRFHLLYRAATIVGGGRLHLDVDATALDQVPNSPHPLEDGMLSARYTINLNINPSDARQDQRRGQANLGYDRKLGGVDWSTTASVTHTDGHNVRGFLRDDFEVADGFRQRVVTRDTYIDTHVGSKSERFDWLVGADLLLGRGRQRSANFEYPVALYGSNLATSTDRTIDESTMVHDSRSFGGIYVQAIVRPIAALTLLGGMRLNRTVEHRCASVGAGTSFGDAEDCDALRRTRLSGTAGASYLLWRSGGNGITAFANYRDTYKPAAIDFGPEAEGEILKPETAHGWEAGLRARVAGGRLSAEASLFDTRFHNLVIRENVGGLPGLANAGGERLRGIEVEGRWAPAAGFSLSLNYAHHLDRFTDYVLAEDGSSDQLGSNRLALSPNDIGSVIATYAPTRGPQAAATLRWVGPRFLDKENEVRSPGYATIDGRIGWRFAAGWGLFVRGENLTRRRDPIAESELGDQQFYRLPERRVLASLEFSR